MEAARGVCCHHLRIWLFFVGNVGLILSVGSVQVPLRLKFNRVAYGQKVPLQQAGSAETTSDVRTVRFSFLICWFLSRLCTGKVDRNEIPSHVSTDDVEFKHSA